MFYLVGIAVQSDNLLVFIKDDTDGSIEAITKSDLKFALKNGLTINGVQIVDGKEQFSPDYLEKDVCLLGDTEIQALQKISQTLQVPLEHAVAEYSHLMNSNTGEIFTLTEGLRQFDQAKKNQGIGVESFNLSEDELAGIDKLSKLFGVTLSEGNSTNQGLMITGLDTLDTLDNTDEYGLSETTENETVETPVESEEESTDSQEEDTVVTKLYAQLDDDQNAILRRYYLWYSQRVFELAGLKGKNTNIHQNTKRMKTKRDAIAKLKKSGGTWMYAGFIDAGREGKKCCEFGHIIDKDKDVCAEGHPVYLDARCEFKHPLRYMHIAWDVEKMDLETAFFGNRYDKRIEQVLHDNKDTAIIFGIACIGDFFDIDPSYKNMLMTTQRNTLKDMEKIYQYYEDGTTQAVLDSFTVMDDFMVYAKKNLAQSHLFGKPSVLDAGTTQFYIQCRDAHLIPPKSLVQMVRDSIIGWDINSAKGHKFTNQGLGSVDKDFFIKVMNIIFRAEFNDLLELAYMQNPHDFLYTNPSTPIATDYTECKYYLDKLHNYFDIYFKYEICGEFYKYKADETSKDEGGSSLPVRTALRDAYSSLRYLWSDLEFSIDYLRKINNFYKLRSSLNLSDCLKAIYQVSYDSTSKRYKIDFNSVRVDYNLIKKYSNEQDSKLAEAVSILAYGHRGKMEGLYTYAYSMGPFNYSKCTIEEATAKIQEAIDIVNAEKTAYTTWVTEHFNKDCSERNAILEAQERQEEESELARKQAELEKEQENVNRLAELKAKEVKKLSNAELVEVLQNSDTDSLEGWQKNILNSAIAYSDKSKLSAKQIFQLQRMFNQLFHQGTTQSKQTKEWTQLDDDTKMKDALEYALANPQDFDAKHGVTAKALDVAKRVLFYGRYSELQYKFYIKAILERYEELGK